MLAAAMLCAAMTTGCTADTENNTSTSSQSTQQTVKEDNASDENDTEEIKLVEQTLVDEITGIEVSGMLPEGAKLDSMIYIIDDFMLSESFDTPYIMEDDHPRVTEISDGMYGPEGKRIDNIRKIMNEKGWAQYEGYAGGKLDISLYIVKGTKVLDFDSDLTVTLPFNYRRGLVNGGITGEATVVQYDYDNKCFVDLEIVPAEDTPKGMFQFKTTSGGQFIAGGNEEVAGYKNLYTPSTEN